MRQVLSACKMCDIIRIFHDCLVWVENLSPWSLLEHHEAVGHHEAIPSAPDNT